MPKHICQRCGKQYTQLASRQKKCGSGITVKTPFRDFDIAICADCYSKLRKIAEAFLNGGYANQIAITATEILKAVRSCNIQITSDIVCKALEQAGYYQWQQRKGEREK